MGDYELRRGSQRLATLTSTGLDMPWHQGSYDLAPAFEEVRPLFEREVSLLEADKIEEWQATWEEIANLGLVLRPLDGREDMTEFLIHFYEDEARWRY
jgi:hypothetical protein